MSGKRICETGFALLVAAVFVAAQPAAAGGARYKAIGFGAAGVAGVGPVLWAKKAANKAIDRALGLADKRSSAVISGNDALGREAEDDLDSFTSDWLKESAPGSGLASRVREAVGNAGAKLKRMASTVKRRTKSFVGGDDADPRIALTRNPDRDTGPAASRIFDSKPLPKANVGAGVAGTRTWKSAPDPWGPAARSPWDGKGRPAGEPRRVGDCLNLPEARKRACHDLVSARADEKHSSIFITECFPGVRGDACRKVQKGLWEKATTKARKARRKWDAANKDAVANEGRDGYEAALAKTLGEERGAAKGDYMGTLEALERKNAERREEARLEAARREAERLVRLEEERREAEWEARLEEERGRRRIESESGAIYNKNTKFERSSRTPNRSIPCVGFRCGR